MEYKELRDEMDSACQRYLRSDLEISDFIREVKRLQRKYHVVTIPSAQVSSRNDVERRNGDTVRKLEALSGLKAKDVLKEDIVRATRAYGEKDVDVDERAE